MRKVFTLIAGFLLFACVYFHIKRQNVYISNLPAPDSKTAMQSSPVNTLTTGTKAALAVSVVANQ
ncbi:hypothetical protein CLV58_12125 [Spirosoma oryzae]|uniref:Uncharacterized protein n=1 Tax=Spirosoma oryzae TaxID=1469603 RepID=A0A2T0SGJ5_9BACT|nr:hypothetical protein [Spirosoma oryzae]PRY32525.1 hypothetical protein CLV58_12125 [Spirosoma oryzae]